MKLYIKDNEGTSLIKHGWWIESSSLHRLNLLIKLQMMLFKLIKCYKRCSSNWILFLIHFSEEFITTTLSTKTLSMIPPWITTECCYSECRLCWVSFKKSVANSLLMMGSVMLTVIMPRAVMLSVTVLSARNCQTKTFIKS